MPKPKGVERLVGRVDVVRAVLLVCGIGGVFGASGVEVVVVHRYLAYVDGHGSGELARGVYIAEYHVGDSVGGFRASEPYIENGGHVAGFPFEYGGASREVEHHHGFTGGEKLLK